MSGPIVRKYGFPNFEQIFGKRELQHGSDAEEVTAEPPADEASDEPADAPAAKSPKAKKPSPARRGKAK